LNSNGQKAGDRTGDKASVRVPPPVVFLVSIISGYYLGAVTDVWYPNWGDRLNGLLAVATATPGALLLLASLVLFKRSGQRPEPWTPTPELIYKGIYQYTRNPMYLGMALIQIGTGIWLQNLWIIVFTPISLLIVLWVAILPEEKYLQTKFGDDYTAYKARVRRWL